MHVLIKLGLVATALYAFTRAAQRRRTDITAYDADSDAGLDTVRSGSAAETGSNAGSSAGSSAATGFDPSLHPGEDPAAGLSAPARLDPSVNAGPSS